MTSEIERNMMSREDKVITIAVKKKIVRCPLIDSDFLVDLATIIFNKAEKHQSCCDGGYSLIMKIPLPAIRSIDGIRCDAQITIGSSGRGLQFTFRLEALMVHGRFDNAHAYYHDSFSSKKDFNGIHSMLLTLLDDIIPDLRYYPMTCEFKKKEELEITTLIEKRMTKNKIDMYAETCGVCFEPTRAKTRCNHTLCVPCADKIQVLALMNTNEYDENSGEPCCPLCREEGGFNITF